MTTRASRPTDEGSLDRRWAILGGLALGLVAILSAALLWVAWVGPAGLASAGAGPSATAGASLEPTLAPSLALTDQDDRPFELSSVRGRPVLVFFGYTHCPDVCPATVGVLNRVLEASSPGLAAVFVSVDPERDTTAAMREYLQFLPDGYTGLTGSPSEIRETADDWGVDYARIDTGSAAGYAMAHTADVFLVDAQGLLRARFPFGTEPGPIAAAVADLEPVAVASPSSAPTDGLPGSSGTASPSPAAEVLRPVVVSTSAWGGETSPIILSLTDGQDQPLDPASTRARVRLLDASGAAVAPSIEATVVHPAGTERTSYLVELPIPSPGRWRLAVEASEGQRTLRGEAELTALDPGATARIGGPAPAARTPTVEDVGGVIAAVTTDPQPDLRLTERSTADARAAGVPYVLLVDSYRFRVSPACGRALAMARVLADRWPDVAFIHLEPFRYSIVTSTPVLDGAITDPPIHAVAEAWGLGQSFWGPTSVPWIFVVDGDGVVRAKYQGVVGSDDIDVILSAMAPD